MKELKIKTWQSIEWNIIIQITSPNNSLDVFYNKKEDTFNIVEKVEEWETVYLNENVKLNNK